MILIQVRGAAVWGQATVGLLFLTVWGPPPPPPPPPKGGGDQVQMAMVLEDATGLEMEDRVLQCGDPTHFRSRPGSRSLGFLIRSVCWLVGGLWQNSPSQTNGVCAETDQPTPIPVPENRPMHL